MDAVETGYSIQASAQFTDPDSPAGTHTADWDWGDGSTDQQEEVTSPAMASHSYGTPGVYEIVLRVTDSDGISGLSEFRYVVVYDPGEGFVTGGGWIMSPEAACEFGACESDTMGKASFGFVSKYKRGVSDPTGQTEFQFQAGDLKFHSQRYDWLVVAGGNAKYKGVGTINGGGEYGFMLTATDAELTPSTDVDLFRIKIWDKLNGEEVVYDNKMGEGDDSYGGTAIGGGNIRVHKANGD
jgi:PKD repeat protein